MPSKALVGAVFCGVLVSLATGLIERRVIGIPEVRQYGYPLVWRIVDLNGPTEYVLVNLVLDAMIWVVVSLAVFLLLDRVVPYLYESYPKDPRLGAERGVTARTTRVVLGYLLVLAFVMKVAGEFVHEALGHGLFVILFGGSVVNLDIAVLWPYRLSGIGFSGAFEAWQLPWIDGGGILVCLIFSSVIQGFLLWKVRKWHVATPLFWLAFWTFLNPIGYLIIGGIMPFGDVSQLIAHGVLSQPSSLALGLLGFMLGFVSLSKNFNALLQSTTLIRTCHAQSVALGMLWLIIPVITGMAIAGLGFLSAYAPILFAISFAPSGIALLVSGHEPGWQSSYPSDQVSLSKQINIVSLRKEGIPPLSRDEGYPPHSGLSVETLEMFSRDRRSGHLFSR